MKVKHNGKVTKKTLDGIRASLIRKNKIDEVNIWKKQ